MIFFSAETGTCLSNRTYTATHIYMMFSSYVNTQSFIVFGGLLEFYSLCFSIILYCICILYVFLFRYRPPPTGRFQSIDGFVAIFLFGTKYIHIGIRRYFEVNILKKVSNKAMIYFDFGP